MFIPKIVYMLYNVCISMFQNESLIQSVYLIPYAGYANKKVSQLILILMINSQRLIRFTAGGFIYMSMECFRTVCIFLIIYTYIQQY